MSATTKTTNNDEIIFYDLPSKTPCKAWSLNPWKTRLLLNYLELPYRTEWIEYPDVAPQLSKIVPPNDVAGGQAMTEYTIPAITLPSGESIMDSLPIAKGITSTYITSTYSSSTYQSKITTLSLDHPILKQLMTDLLPPVLTALQPIYIPGVPSKILNPPSAEYFRRTREKRFGTTLEALRDDPVMGGERKPWERARGPLREIGKLFHDGGSGSGSGSPWLLGGKEPSYADFVIVAMIKMFDRLGHLDDLVEAGGDEFKRVYEACGPWLERDDH